MVKRTGIVLFFFFIGSPAFALSLLPSSGSSVTGLLSSDTVSMIAQSIGSIFGHRAYEPATPLGTQLGLDIGIEAELVQAGSLNTAFGVTIPFLPSARELNIHKGITHFIDIGASVLTYSGYVIWSAELKVAFLVPEEGPTWAIRASYTNLHFPLGSYEVFVDTVDLSLDTNTWAPEILMSKKLDAFDPYIGIGYQYVTGGITPKVSGLFPIDLSSVSGSGGSFYSFLGLSIAPPKIAFRITLEGAYSMGGYNRIGTKIGFTF